MLWSYKHNPNSIYIPIKICLERYNQYELTAYIDSGCSVCFEKRSVFLEFMWKKVKNPLQVRIANNNIMSHDEAIEVLNKELGGVQCVIPVLWILINSRIIWLLEIIFKTIFSMHTYQKPNNIHNKWSLSSYW